MTAYLSEEEGESKEGQDWEASRQKQHECRKDIEGRYNEVRRRKVSMLKG